MAKSVLEETLALHIRAECLPKPVREFQFHPDRKWRADFAWPALRILCEVEGGLFGGRHVRPAGFEDDVEKYNEAQRLGWRVYRFTSRMVTSGQAIAFLREVLCE